MDFSHISTMDEWSSALKELVDKARTADTHEKRIEVSIELTDTQGGGPPFNFRVETTAANLYAARDLGIEKVSSGGGTISGNGVSPR